jgi:hypothetical protein
MKIILFLSVGFIGLLQGAMFSTQITPLGDTSTYQKIKFLDQKILLFEQINGLKFSEISDLAYDRNEKRLFFVSDEGRLFVFDARFSEKIEKLEALTGMELVQKSGKKFKSWERDSEGLTLNNKAELFASFEGAAKIGKFDKKGRLIKRYHLPGKLSESKNYRSRNKSLEALTWHPKYGLLTATEWPLKQMHKKKQTIYGIDGKEWHFNAEKEGKSAVVAIEVMDDGNLLVMERSFTGLMNPLVITLKKVYIQGCKRKKEMCKSEEILKMNTHKGWDIDNFEGLAKVGQHRYVMVSDDNDNFYQKTLLIYFEISH